MSNADEDALRAMRAASPALQEFWAPPQLASRGGRHSRDMPPPGGVAPPHWRPLEDMPPPMSHGESPRFWRGVVWGDASVYDGVQQLDLSGSKLEVLPPQILQLQGLTMLELQGCPLKELPPEFGQMLALNNLYLSGCEQLTLAPGAKKGQPAQTIVAAYARLLIVEPRKDTPGQLHAFLIANPLAVPAFFKYIVGDLTGDALLANWLGEALKATPELAHLTAPDGRSVTDVAEQARLSRATAKPDEVALH